MRGGGRPSPRSVDSEIKRCVIEPRNYHRREPSSWTLAGAELGISYTWTHRRAWSHRGRRNMANDRTGFTGTWETFPSPSLTAGWSPAYQLQVDPRLPSRACGNESGTKRWYRQAKETKCGEKTVRKSQRPILVTKRGNGPSRTLWSEGGAALWTGSWNHAEDAVPHQRVTAKRPSRVRDSDIPQRDEPGAFNVHARICGSPRE